MVGLCRGNITEVVGLKGNKKRLSFEQRIAKKLLLNGSDTGKEHVPEELKMVAYKL